MIRSDVGANMMFRMLLFAAFTIACFCAEPELYPIREGRKFGYINRAGTVVVPPSYDSVKEFHDGLACFYMEAKAGYLNSKGMPAIPVQFDSCGDFGDGHAIVRNGAEYLVIDAKGNTTAHVPHRVLGEYHAGLVKVQRARATGPDGKAIPSAYGYIDRRGKVVIEPKFMPAGDFPDDGAGLAVGGFEHDWCYFDRQGTILIRVPIEGHDRADPFVDGLLRIKEGFYWGYRDYRGQWAIKPQFDSAGSFERGFAAVELKGKQILIDHSGHKVEPKKGPVSIGPLSDGLMLMRDADRLGYANADGRLAFPLRKYDAAYAFSCGRARIKLDGKFGYLDKGGNLAIPNQFASASDFDNCLASVMTRDGWAYIDASGKTVWQGK